ncbi:MAG: hypothetical protein GY868_13930, partial [Deltaproteobacteria bacterium]|nr:hypothetical protein [Deltaproteobacteria bacterium]
LWLFYFSIWFIAQGVWRTAFPEASRTVVNRMQASLNLELSDDQKKTLMDIIGGAMMVAIALGLAAAAIFIISGFLVVVGKISW